MSAAPVCCCVKPAMVPLPALLLSSIGVAAVSFCLAFALSVMDLPNEKSQDSLKTRHGPARPLTLVGGKTRRPQGIPSLYSSFRTLLRTPCMIEISRSLFELYSLWILFWFGSLSIVSCCRTRSWFRDAIADEVGKAEQRVCRYIHSPQTPLHLSAIHSTSISETEAIGLHKSRDLQTGNLGDQRIGPLRKNPRNYAQTQGFRVRGTSRWVTIAEHGRTVKV